MKLSEQGFNDNGDGTGDFNFTATDDHSATTLSFLFEAKDPGDKTSATVSRIPLNGQTIFARLHFKKDGVWDSNDFTYTTINKNSTKINRIIRKDQFFMIESK